MPKYDTNENDFLKEIAPTLLSKKIQPEVQTPEGYFDSFAERLKPRLPITPTEPTKIKILQVINFQNLAIAASVAAIIAFGLMLRNDDTSARDMIVWDEAAIDIATEYIDDQELYGSLTNAEVNNIAGSWEYSDQDADEMLLDFDIDDDFFYD